MSDLAHEPQPQEAADQPDINELLDPFNENYGENLAQILAQRDKALLGQVEQLVPAVPDAPSVADQRQQADQQETIAWVGRMLEAEGIDRAHAQEIAAVGEAVFNELRPNWPGTTDELSKYATEAAINGLREQQASEGQVLAQEFGNEVAGDFLRSMGVTAVNTQRVLERAAEILDERGNDGSQRAAADALYRAAEDLGGRTADPKTPLSPEDARRRLVDRFSAINGALERAQLAAEPKPAQPVRDANGRFAKSGEELLGRFFPSSHPNSEAPA